MSVSRSQWSQSQQHILTLLNTIWFGSDRSQSSHIRCRGWRAAELSVALIGAPDMIEIDDCLLGGWRAAAALWTPPEPPPPAADNVESRSGPCSVECHCTRACEFALGIKFASASIKLMLSLFVWQIGTV